MLIPVLPLVPRDAIEVSGSLAIRIDAERVEFFNAGGPIGSYRADDRTGILLAAINAIHQGMASQAAMARALSIHRTTLHRAMQNYDANGVAGVVAKRTGPKRPHTFTPDVLERAQSLLEEGLTTKDAAAELGVSERGLRSAISRGLVTRPVESGGAVIAPEIGTEEATVDATGPRDRSDVDQSCLGGIGVKRTTERALAACGKLTEAVPKFQATESVQGAGVLLAIPALLEQGLIDVGEEIYGTLRDGFFGLRSILLTFAFMALLRIKTPEQLTEHAPGELGLLLGLDRAPEVKTLRRKLAEIGARGQAHEFGDMLAQRWAEAESSEVGLLYIDGHVRPYHGRKHRLPKLHVQQRNRPMPGTKDFYVNDQRADPLLFVTAEATEGLLETLDTKLLPDIRELVGADRRITIAFDREGWSPKLFAKWRDLGIDVLTYRKGKQTKWRNRFFKLVKGEVAGADVSYMLAERRVTIAGGVRVREIRRLTESGHQTAIITTNESLSLIEVAHRMFSRWKQENFFRYMRQEFAIDHLCTYDVEAADPDRMVPCPVRRGMKKELAVKRTTCAKLNEKFQLMESDEQLRVGRKNLYDFQVRALIAEQKAAISRLEVRVANQAKEVPLSTLLEPDEIVKLERERKRFVDHIKLLAFRAESTLVRIVAPMYARHEDEARKLLKSIFAATADITPDENQGTLTVRFHGLANPRATRALVDLCEAVSDREVTYPGTSLRLRFEGPNVAKIAC